MQRFIRKFIDFIIMLVVILTLADLCASTNLDGQIIGGILAVVTVIGYIIFLARRHVINWFPLPARLSTVLRSKWLFLALALIYQLTLLIGLASETGFDTGIVKWGASSTTITDGSYLDTYFSHNPNNLGLLFAERFIFRFTGAAHFTIVLDIINLLLIDLAILLVALTLKRHLQRPIVWSLLPFIALISPWIVVVYSDTAVLPFVAAMVYLLDNLIHQFASTAKLSHTILSAALLGFVTWAAYVLKITALIILIALVLELLIKLLKKQTHFNWSRLGIATGTFIVIFGLFFGANKAFLSHQQLLSLDQNITELPSHYIMMGMNKDTLGGYSQDDFLLSTQQPTKKAQQKANMAEIQKRLRNFGIIGYAHFLLVKHAANVGDGTLGWLQEGDFFNKPNLNHHPFIRSFFYPGGTRLRFYQTIAQVLWIITFFGVLFSFADRSFIARVLRMALFGLFVYVLFFEGGRSRYLIQFLPVISTLSVIGWYQFKIIATHHTLFKLNLKR